MLGDKPGASGGWLEYTAVTGAATTALRDLVPTNAVKAFWSDAWNSSNGMGKYNPGTNGVDGALTRGGRWTVGSNAGVFNADLNSSPSYSTSYVGFRCKAAPSP